MEQKIATFVTEISEEDFKRLNLTGYFCPGGSWTKININDILDRDKKLAKKSGEDFSTACVAIHTEYSIEDVQKEIATSGITFEQAVSKCLYDYSYLDKILTKQGNQTYIVGIGIDHVYSIRNWWESHKEETFRIPKAETKSIYIIHLED